MNSPFYSLFCTQTFYHNTLLGFATAIVVSPVTITQRAKRLVGFCAPHYLVWTSTVLMPPRGAHRGAGRHRIFQHCKTDEGVPILFYTLFTNPHRLLYCMIERSETLARWWTIPLFIFIGSLVPGNCSPNIPERR